MILVHWHPLYGRPPSGSQVVSMTRAIAQDHFDPTRFMRDMQTPRSINLKAQSPN
jgi:hypothetical protein